jgi:hypothetical protein
VDEERKTGQIHTGVQAGSSAAGGVGPEHCRGGAEIGSARSGSRANSPHVAGHTKYKDAGDWVFASPFSKGRKPYWGQSIMSNQIRKVARGVGISKKIGWHTFRHTCATLLRPSGADIKVVQELLRHASCRVTLDTYTQAVTERKRAAQNKIAGLVHGLKHLTHQIHRPHRHPTS